MKLLQEIACLSSHRFDNRRYYKLCAYISFGKSFVLNNYQLREHFHLAGVFQAMPKELSENNSQAEELFNESDLESWFSAVTTTLTEDYR